MEYMNLLKRHGKCCVNGSSVFEIKMLFNKLQKEVLFVAESKELEQHDVC